MFHLNRRNTYKDTLKDYKIPTLPAIHILKCALFIKQYYNDLLRKYEWHIITTQEVDYIFVLAPATSLTNLQKSTLFQSVKTLQSLTFACKNHLTDTFLKYVKNILGLKHIV